MRQIEWKANVAFDEMLKQQWHRQVLSRLAAIRLHSC